MRFSIQAIAWEATRIYKMHAPVRDWRVYSPYGPPGNLKNQGIYNYVGRERAIITIGGKPAPYAKYTETRSRRKYWMKKSENRIRALPLEYSNVRRKI